MKKKVLSLALAAMAFVSINALAQSPTATTSCSKDKTECADCNGKDCKGKKGNKEMRQGRQNPFEGIELTEAQKTQINQLREAQKANMQKPDKDGKREKPTQEQIAAREAQHQQFMQDVKKILTPEQYTKFEQNVAKMHDSKNRQGGKDMRNNGKGRRNGDRKGGNRPASGAQAKAN